MIKIRIKLRTLLIAIILLVGIILSIYFYNKFQEEEKKEYIFNFEGIPIVMRAKIKDSYSIPIFPNEDFLNYSAFLLLSGAFKNVYMVFNNSDNLGNVALQSFQITYVLKLIFIKKNLEINISGLEFSQANFSLPNYYIFVKNTNCNQNFINVTKLNFIEICGVDTKGLDLATTRFLVYLLKYK